MVEPHLTLKSVENSTFLLNFTGLIRSTGFRIRTPLSQVYIIPQTTA